MKKYIQEYRTEIAAVLVALFGVFLVVEQFEIRETMLEVYLRLADSLKRLALTTQEKLVAYITNFTPSDFLGWVLIIVTSVFIFWRVRYRFLNSDYWKADQCPKCGGELHRIHRSLLDRVLSWIIMPHARRYLCADSNCTWSGLRRYQSYKQRRHHREDSSLDQL